MYFRHRLLDLERMHLPVAPQDQTRNESRVTICGRADAAGGVSPVTLFWERVRFFCEETEETHANKETTKHGKP